MKIAILTMIMALAIPTLASADFKPETQQDIGKILVDYYRAEQGNKLTVYSMDGLLRRIEQTFQGNIVQPPPPSPAPVEPEK